MKSELVCAIALSRIRKLSYWLQRLDDRRPGCAVLWLTGDVSMWSWCVVLVQAVVVRWLLWCRSPLLGEARASLLLELSFVGAGLAGVTLQVLVAGRYRNCCWWSRSREGVVRRLKVVSEDFLMLALRRAVWMRKAAVVGLAGCARSAAVVGSCVDCWLESRHQLLGWPGAARLWQLLLIRPWSDCYNQRRQPECVYFCLCLPPDRTWHKVNDPKVELLSGFGERKVGHEPSLEPCWTMLVIGPFSAMWTWWAWLDMDPNMSQGTDAWL